jgi:phosphoribosylanthranilate isomerase
MTTRVKICGITRLEDATLAVELGAAALGFNFYPESPRYIEPEEAREIVRGVPPLVASIGVFVDETSPDYVYTVARDAGVNAIQLHNCDFSVDPGPTESIIRAVIVDERFQPESLRFLKAGAFLLDAFHPTLKGGTGRTIDWNKAREATRYGCVILAGGLTSENVGEAIRQVRPFAVDVASGVESAPGIKDAGRLRAFFAAVHEADRDSLA